MRYFVVFCSSLVEAFLCGFVFLILGFGAVSFLAAALGAFASVWIGYFCARSVVRRLTPGQPYLLAAPVGVVLGVASAAAFCHAAGVSPETIFLVIGAAVGMAMGLINVWVWRGFECL
jgi:hypothetical protein